MGKKFMGLGGTDHFWDRAKAWILNQITSAVAAKIAEVVANAPEDLDTLKEIADWIKTHANDAAAMNTQIQTNKNSIATNTSDISDLKTSVAGKADKVHTHSAGDITSGTLPIANGGTGATDAKNGFMSLANGLTQADSPQDAEYMIYRAGGNWGLYTLLQFWEYIKGKISSVLGLTATQYNGNANTANKIEPIYTTKVELSEVTSETTKYIKIADCAWTQTGTLQVHLDGNGIQDTLVINFGGGHSEHPMLCGYYIPHRYCILSAIATISPKYDSNYSIYIKIEQRINCNVQVALLKGACTINITESTTAPTNISEWSVSNGFFGNLTGNSATATSASTADKAVEVVDYGNTSRTVKVGFGGQGVTADKLLYLAGYTEDSDSSVKLKDVRKEELIKWLGIPRIKYADYQTPTQTFTQFQQVTIELSKFSSEVTPNNVLCFMVIYWSGVQLIASADLGNTSLKCALIALQAGTSYAIIRCVYMV